jgi:hypothetical protein
MPSGIQLSLTKKPPRCFSFVLTDAIGKRLFGCSLVFYQQIPDGILAKSQVQVKETVYATKSICLLSHYPFYRAQREWLCFIFESLTKSSKTPMHNSIEQEIIHMVMNVPLPPENLPMTLKIDQKKPPLPILRTRTNNIPIVDVYVSF